MFMMGWPHYGCQGEVSESSSSITYLFWYSFTSACSVTEHVDVNEYQNKLPYDVVGLFTRAPDKREY